MKQGVTLIELVMVIGIVALLVGATLPFGLSFYYRFQYITGHAQTTSTLRTAQAKALGMEHGASHGISIDFTNSILTEFEGDDYASREPTQDFHVDLEDVTISSTFGPQIVFEKETGNPSHTGSITISSRGGSAQVTINEEGLIQ